MPAPANRSAPATPPTRFIGCDAGKRAIVVFDSRDGTTRSLPNQPQALAAFAAALDATCLVVCEPTGGHEDALLAALLAAGCPAHRADARKVKAFIRSYGTLAKTDALDAHALARYAQERHSSLVRWQAPDPDRERLQALVLARTDLVGQRTACTNRLAAPGLAHPGVAPVCACLMALRDCLDTQIRALETAIAQTLRETPHLARAQQVLRSIGGLSERTAAALLALMPELGHLDRRKAAALAGLAPHPRQSGARDAYRPARGGRKEVRQALFMAALCASRHDARLKEAYQRLRAAGKKPLLAITAIMRRIIVIANARLRDDRQSTQNQLS